MKLVTLTPASSPGANPGVPGGVSKLFDKPDSIVLSLDTARGRSGKASSLSNSFRDMKLDESIAGRIGDSMRSQVFAEVRVPVRRVGRRSRNLVQRHLMAGRQERKMPAFVSMLGAISKRLESKQERSYRAQIVTLVSCPRKILALLCLLIDS